jgi:hypothetical protein
MRSLKLFYVTLSEAKDLFRSTEILRRKLLRMTRQEKLQPEERTGFIPEG